MGLNMLIIKEIRIEGMKDNCITDCRPIISFSLESNKENEALKKAFITVGNWSIETKDQINNLFEGEMKPFANYTVYIRAEGISGEKAEATTTFSTGRLNRPWKAKWITDAEYHYSSKESPVPMNFRYYYKLRDMGMKRAWINITALGIYELFLNGKKVGNDYFTPGFTSYEHQIQYQSYEVKNLLEKENILGAVVAGGWAAGAFGNNKKSQISADRQALLCELHIEYEDGTCEVIGTNENWEVTEEGNYRGAEWYDGEVYDATVNIDDVQWKKASVTRPRQEARLLAQYGCSVRKKEEKIPISIIESPDGETIYDFGQNFAGVIAAKIQGKKNQKIIFKHAEVLVDNKLFTKSLRTAKATAIYVCSDGEQFYSPRLTYMGFRYVGVSGIKPENIQLSAFVLYSDMELTGDFKCSNDMINQLQSNIRWGGKSNFVDIPTDCPQRDERLGWTGDIAVFAKTACYNFDMSRFLNKWLIDMRSEQGKGGGFPMVIPKAGDNWPTMSSSCWGDSCILVPWAEYLSRGNIQLLKEQYPAMKKYLKAVKWWSSFASLTPDRKHIWSMPYHWGDWCAPEGNAKDWVSKGKWIGTAYFANSCGIVSKIAEILGETEDSKYYRRLRKNIIKAYRNVFTDGAGRLKKEFQTGYVLPLYFNMAQGMEKEEMVNNLVKLIKKSDNHLATGFPGTPYLLFALSDNNKSKEAYDLLLQTSCPSWLYAVKAGATTIWERWDALREDGTVNVSELSGRKTDEETSGGMVSFNHYANGAVGDWLYRRVLGIEPISGGYKKFRIMPIPGGNLTYAKGCLMTPFGRIQSEWKIENNIFMIEVEIPVSTTYFLTLPDGNRVKLYSGKYHYSCKI